MLMGNRISSSTRVPCTARLPERIVLMEKILRSTRTGISPGTTPNLWGRREMASLRYDLARITLAVLFITALIGTSLWVMRPFLPAVIWAATLVIATWPIMRRLQTGLWNSRALATTIVTSNQRMGKLPSTAAPYNAIPASLRCGRVPWSWSCKSYPPI